MRSLCPRCGGELPFDFLGRWFETSARCPECGVAPAAVPTVLPISEDEVTYTLTDMPPTDRSAVTGALVEDDIRYRWGPDLVLAVAVGAEREVDRVLEDFADSGASAADADGGEEAGIGAEEADGGEEATEAMGDLFVAADRLLHAPYDEAIGTELSEAASAAGASLPPYGVEAPVWRTVQDLATSVLSDLEQGADEDVVVADARALRDFLRDYV